MVCVLISCEIHCGFEHLLGQTKDNKIGISCFSTKHAVFKGQTDWLGIRIMHLSGETCLPADCGLI
jgi:hypothetical protein